MVDVPSLDDVEFLPHEHNKKMLQAYLRRDDGLVVDVHKSIRNDEYHFYLDKDVGNDHLTDSITWREHISDPVLAQCLLVEFLTAEPEDIQGDRYDD